MPKLDSKASPAMTTRRNALGVSLTVLGVGYAASAKASDDQPRQDYKILGRIASLAVGDIREVEYPKGHEAFVTRLGMSAEGGIGSEHDIVAFHRACPHQGCHLHKLNIERGELGPCGCHLSLFDLRRGGAQIEGLASQNLVQIKLTEHEGDIVALGVKGLPYGDALTEEYA